MNQPRDTLDGSATTPPSAPSDRVGGMQMTVDCPGCAIALVVPETAAGRRARCTRCDTRFRIPSAQELLDQTMAHLLTESFLDEDDLPSPPPVLDNAPSKDSSPREVDSEADRSLSEQSRAPTAPPTSDTDSDSASHETLDGHPAVDHASDDQPTHDTLSHPDEEPDGEPHGQDISDTAKEAGGYPTELTPSRPRPHLVVRGVSMEGVKLAFDAHWLNHETFRTSMPIRCALTGREASGGLRARPVIFLNKYRQANAPLHSIESRYETAVDKDCSPRSLARAMGYLEGMPEPFEKPIVYYAAIKAEGQSLQAQAHAHPGGQTVCEMLIPHGKTAIDWLERVNGRCGPEYAKLRDEAAMLTCNAWTSLEPTTRERLEHWCQFQPREQFCLYLNDADFSAQDAGLAGLVLTDARLIYHKFRHSRSIALNRPAVVHVRTDDKMARLTLESGGRLAPAGKIHVQDVPRLVEALAHTQWLRVDVRQRDKD